MVERYIKTVGELLRKVVASHQRNGDERLLLFLLAYRASTHDTTGLTPAGLVFGRELRLPCDLLFGAPPDKERPTTDLAADLVDHLHDIRNYAGWHIKKCSTTLRATLKKLARMYLNVRMVGEYRIKTLIIFNVRQILLAYKN
jgi:hypothetical protein